MHERGFQSHISSKAQPKMTPAEVNAFFGNTKSLRLSKTLQEYMGLWPYQSSVQRFFRQVGVPVVLCIVIIVPHILAIKKRCRGEESRLGQCCENLAGMSYISGCLLKYSIPILKEKKFKRLYTMIAEHWAGLTDPNEKEIMLDFARQGRLRGILFCVCMAFSAGGYMQITFLPVVLDYIMPLNESRPRILVMNGEYPFDPFEYYHQVYMAYLVGTVASVFCMIAHDVMYVMIVDQTLGVFQTIIYRVQKAALQMDEKSQYKMMISAIDKHALALKFIAELETTYQALFITFISLGVSILILSAIFIVDHGDNIIDTIRIGLFGLGATIFVFFLTWPGQLLTDGGDTLFFSIFSTEWYKLSQKAKNILRIMLLRCSKPIFLTAGGIYIMNFENYAQIIKTTVSYMVVATSFR